MYYVLRSVGSVHADPEKIHRALINILSNCIKYTKDNIKIDIVDGVDTVGICIADNGDGFGDEDICALLSGLTKAKSNGSGIGLSIVNEIVKAHDGQFLIGNKSDAGAEFKLILKR